MADEGVQKEPPDDTRRGPSAGSPPGPPVEGDNPFKLPESGWNPIGRYALGLGLLSLLLPLAICGASQWGWAPLPVQISVVASVVAGPAAVILGVLGIRSDRRSPTADGPCCAVLGIMLGGVVTLLCCCIIALVIFLGGKFF